MGAILGHCVIHRFQHPKELRKINKSASFVPPLVIYVDVSYKRGNVHENHEFLILLGFDGERRVEDINNELKTIFRYFRSKLSDAFLFLDQIDNFFFVFN